MRILLDPAIDWMAELLDKQLLEFMEAHMSPFELALNKTAKQVLEEFPELIPEPTPRQPERFKGYQSTRRKYK